MLRKFLCLATLLLLCFSAGAGTIKGKVSCFGKPVAGVRVSDGRAIVLTDSRGRYSIKSEKADSIVFITTPSGYVAKPVDAIRPGFWRPLVKSASAAETVDFELVPENQDNYTILFITDTHFANDPGRSDLKRFSEEVFPAIYDKVKSIRKTDAVYSVNLGDFSHDRYWYDFGMNEYAAQQYLLSIGYPTLIYSVSGNHDNDGAIAGKDESNDFPSAWCYRKTWGPDRYSVEIGGDHWIFMDNIVYINNGNPDKKHKNINGSRNYRRYFTDSQLEWLKADLATVDPSTKVYFCCHCPIFNDFSKSEHIEFEQLEILDSIFSAFPEVTVFSGHAHKLINTGNEGYRRFRQYVLPATSGSMWNAPEGLRNISGCGADQGFTVFTPATGSVQYCPIDGSDRTMRIYDGNGVRKYFASDEKAAMLRKNSPKHTDWSSDRFENTVIVNIWGAMPGDRIEILEAGKPLEVKKVKMADPLYDLIYVLPNVKESTAPGKYDKDHKSPHLYMAKAESADAEIVVRVVTPEGKLRCKSGCTRPKTFDKDAN